MRTSLLRPNRSASILPAGLLVLAWCAGAAETPGFIWVEAEAAKSNTMTRHPWWYDKVKKDQLSGKDYLSNWGDKPGEATYEFESPEAKDYTFWLRANPTQTKFSYKLDAGEWTPIDLNAKQQDIVNLAEDDKIDLRFLAWEKAGTVNLAKGKHTLVIRMHSENKNHGMLDCFTFTSIPFNPSGTMKPGEKAAPVKAATEEGHWAFTPEKDEFKPEAKFDLRTLNEKIAGESGFVTRTKDGNDFLLGNGKPARFWALNTNAYERANVDLDRHARFMSKRGVNLVRFHGNLTPTGKDLNEIDKAEREKLWRLVAAMKKEGIYTTFSPYWAVSSRVKPALGVLDAGKGGNMGLLFFDKKLQEAYRGWLKQVFSEKNPYTGIPLAQEPALAIIQIQNEDSLLFWSSQGIEGAAAQELRKQFGAFLTQKYGSLDKAKQAWGNVDVKGDNFAAGEVGLNGIWELTQRRAGAQQKRDSDQMEFMTMTMFNFNKMVVDYLRNDLGCKQLINAGNWRTADNVTLLDGERYSYSATEVMGVNRYYTGEHKGPNEGWAIVNGDLFTDPSVLLSPRDLPVNLKQVDGFPIIIPESSWVPPLSYQSEGPFLVSAYQSLNGVDAYYWFATGEEDWRQPGSANGYLPSEGKWVCATPMLLGQWPAAAYMYRMGYVKKGEPAVFEQRSLADLWERKMPLIAEDAGYDPNRDKDNVSKQSNLPGGVHPLAFLVGPVVAKYGGDPAKSTVQAMDKYIDDAQKKARSNTGELEWNYGDGLCTLNSPKAQGVTGFLSKTGDFKLGSVEIHSSNKYATVLVVALDDKELKSSAKVLVQVGTSERPTGWKTSPAKLDKHDAEKIENFGKGPWQIVNADVTVSIANPALKVAHVLDSNGMPVKDIPLENAGALKKFAFPPDALYVELE